MARARDWIGKQLMRASGASRLEPRLAEIRELLAERVREDAVRQRQWDRYAALAVLRERYPEMFGGAGGDLSSFELSVFSQNGEDGVLLEILHRIGVGSGSFVEFGAGDGTENCCCVLSDVLGWSGLFAELDDVAFDRLRAKYANNPTVSTIQSAITPDNVNTVFAEQGVPVDFDVLSIDVDGSDFWIWQALDTHRPRVVIIEYNSALAATSSQVQPRDIEEWSKTQFFGASLGALQRLAADKGYDLVHLELTGANAFFVRRDVVWCDASRPTHRGPSYHLRGDQHATAPPDHHYVDPSA